MGKATKYVKLIPGKVKGDAFYWAIRFWDYVLADFGLPKILISDHDGRFLSKFWSALFKKPRTTLAMTTAFHPQANGQVTHSLYSLDSLYIYLNYVTRNSLILIE
jgi:hypothetical protein